MPGLPRCCAQVKSKGGTTFYLGLNPEEAAAALGGAAQFPNNYTGTGVPITPKPR